jgi:uncharacterized cupredoxin-like copper-binding protein
LTVRIRAILLATVLVVAGACGSSNDKSSNAQAVSIDMRDIAFSPNQVTVPAGKAIRFEFHNRGKVAHDAYIGDEQMQMAHERDMATPKSSMDGAMHHGDTDAVTVKPGKSAALTHTFKAGDQMLIGCHEPGHYAAGMKVTVAVS